jgi:hypothetical protein
MGPEGSFSCSQEPANAPYLEPDESNLIHRKLIRQFSCADITKFQEHYDAGDQNNLFYNWLTDDGVLNWGSLGGIVTDYGLDDRMIGVRFPVGAANFSLPHGVQIGSGAHLASYPMATGDSFPGVKVTGAWS